jgi:hypothetical protein
MLVAAGLVAACGGDATGPGNGPNRAHAGDPSGDTYQSAGKGWDLTGLTLVRDTGGITVTLDFSTTVVSLLSGDSDAVIAFVDFDTDQDSATGVVSTVDEFRPNSASTGMGVDYSLDLSRYELDSTVAVVDSLGTVMGQVRPVFSGKHIAVRIPFALLGGDDGNLAAAAIVGTLASPSDIVPETGHLSLGTATAVRREIPDHKFRVPSSESSVAQRVTPWRAPSPRH